MASNAERFINAFVEIEGKLHKMCDSKPPRRFYQKVNILEKQSAIIKRYASVLKDYAELRNAIVHQRDGNQEIIAEPTLKTVEEIEHLRDILVDEKKVEDFFLKNVVVCNINDKIIDVAKKMIDLDISKIPVLKNGRFFGVLTNDELIRWAVLEIEAKNDAQYVQDIVSKSNSSNRILFISRFDDVFKVVKYFDDSVTKGYKILAIIVTEHGFPSEKPIGIITFKDLPRIIEWLN